jgi:3-oxoacyl-[acyl-carrier protein] reductase
MCPFYAHSPANAKSKPPPPLGSANQREPARCKFEVMPNQPTISTAPAPGVTLSLASRTALITGGSRGIGAATVRLFRQAGARVAFSYRQAADQANALSAACGGPDLCLPIQQSLESPEDGHALVAHTLAAFGDLDILIVNHGIWPAAETSVAAMTAAQWHRTIATNLDSVFGLVHAAAAHMLTRPAPTPVRTALGSPYPTAPTARGHIVLIASAAGQRGEGFHADYATTKGAIIALTKSLSSELAPHAIYANCVAPGWTHTEMTASVFDDPAVAILFLCTPLAGFISGEIFNVNGGAVLTG